MQIRAQAKHLRILSLAGLGLAVAALLVGCQPSGNANLTTANSNANISNSVANSSNLNAISTTGTTVDTREPEQYQGTVTLTMEALGTTQKTTLPKIAANVARNGTDRVMEFALPNGERVIYLDKAGTNYLILPNRKQYAELNRESLGFEVRRLLMPEHIVDQVRDLQGVRMAGEETINGRQVVRYTYAATADTQTQAGQVDTEAYVLVDKETGLPLRAETVSETAGQVQGYKGMRLVTEMTDIRPTPDTSLFNLPTDYQKIDAEQVRAQVNLVFNTVAALIGQAMQQAQPAATPTPAASPAQ